jgi:K+-transporting ATPase ATPase B chain
MAQKISLWNPDILRHAILDSFRKLDPRAMMKNPVMFVVEIGSVVTSALLIEEGIRHQPIGFDLQITLWLWFTVLFANFAEAIAEGRGKAQADSLRKAKGETIAYRLRSDGSVETVSSSQLRSGDIITVQAGQAIAGDGEVIVVLHKPIHACDSNGRQECANSRWNGSRYVRSCCRGSRRREYTAAR